MKWRVWWISPVPGPALYVEFQTRIEAEAALEALAQFDLHRVEIGDAGDWLANAGGIETWNEEDKEWEEDE